MQSPERITHVSSDSGADRTELRNLRHEPEIGELLGSLVDAARFSPLHWPRSVFGKFGSMKHSRYSEYELVWRLPRYLADVVVPSLPGKPPPWLGPPFSWLFFHRAGELSPPEGGSPTNETAGEQWFFINGILTNRDVARMNAAYLAELFGRPIRILWNSTDGAGLDLLECASEKLGARDADVDMAFHPLLDAITDPMNKRVVLIAHSQGTLIAAVVLRLMRAVYERTMAGTPGELSSEDRDAVRRHAAREGLTVRSERLKPTGPEDLARFEVYCFANCATEMKYIDSDLGLPRIESFGNEHDLVARLGMLAPHPEKRQIEISGPRFRHNGAWGHLLSAHYLVDIDRAHRQHEPRPGASRGAAPYVLIEGTAPAGTVPHLFGYLHGAGALS